MKQDIKKNAMNELVSSALEFFGLAVDQFESNPKMSIVNFAASLELILKTRLIKEHWAMLFDKVDDASIEKFLSGDFQSVSASKIVQRINSLSTGEIDKCEQIAYSELFSHRNKIVHYYHKHLNDEKVKNSVYEKELLAWHFLHNRFKLWNKMYTKEQKSNIASIVKKMRRIQAYGKTVFKSVKNTVESEKARGMFVGRCYLCGQESNVQYATEYSGEDCDVVKSKCLVCLSFSKELVVRCKKCGCVDAFDEELKTCTRCGEPYFGDDGKHCSFSHGDHDSFDVYCSECDSTNIFQDENGLYVCTECGSFADDYGFCGWCNDGFLGFFDEDSFLYGCNHCGGRLGNMKDD